MGIEAEIYDKENNPILTSLKDDIICPICCAVLEVSHAKILIFLKYTSRTPCCSIAVADTSAPRA